MTAVKKLQTEKQKSGSAPRDSPDSKGRKGMGAPTRGKPKQSRSGFGGGYSGGGAG